MLYSIFFFLADEGLFLRPYEIFSKNSFPLQNREHFYLRGQMWPRSPNFFVKYGLVRRFFFQFSVQFMDINAEFLIQPRTTSNKTGPFFKLSGLVFDNPDLPWPTDGRTVTQGSMISACRKPSFQLWPSTSNDW